MAQEHDESRIGLARLTATEKSCLKLVHEGKTSKEIARVVGITPNSVDSAIRDACAKMGTRSRVMAAQMLTEAGDTSAEVTVTSADPKFGTQVQSLSQPVRLRDNEPSAGEGDGPGDLGTGRDVSADSTGPRDGRASPEKHGPYVKFLRGQNKFSKLQRLLIIIAFAVAIVMAYGGIIDGLREVAKLTGH